MGAPLSAPVCGLVPPALNVTGTQWKFSQTLPSSWEWRWHWPSWTLISKWSSAHPVNTTYGCTEGWGLSSPRSGPVAPPGAGADRDKRSGHLRPMLPPPDVPGLDPGVAAQLPPPPTTPQWLEAWAGLRRAVGILLHTAWRMSTAMPRPLHGGTTSQVIRDGWTSPVEAEAVALPPGAPGRGSPRGEAHDAETGHRWVGVVTSHASPTAGSLSLAGPQGTGRYGVQWRADSPIQASLPLARNFSEADGVHGEAGAQRSAPLPLAPHFLPSAMAASRRRLLVPAQAPLVPKAGPEFNLARGESGIFPLYPLPPQALHAIQIPVGLSHGDRCNLSAQPRGARRWAHGPLPSPPAGPPGETTGPMQGSAPPGVPWGGGRPLTQREILQHSLGTSQHQAPAHIGSLYISHWRYSYGLIPGGRALMKQVAGLSALDSLSTAPLDYLQRTPEAAGSGGLGWPRVTHQAEGPPHLPSGHIKKSHRHNTPRHPQEALNERTVSPQIIRQYASNLSYGAGREGMVGCPSPYRGSPPGGELWTLPGSTGRSPEGGGGCPEARPPRPPGSR